VRLGLIIGFVLSIQLAIAGEKGVSWAMIDPFCGQVTSAEPKTFPMKAARIRLYRATAKHLPCCESAEPLGSVRVDAKGNFDLRKLSPGQYWLVTNWEKIEVPVALWYEGKHDFVCDERYTNVIEIKPSAKTVERSVIVSTNSLTHAQTH
jgi:hypothetical protein